MVSSIDICRVEGNGEQIQHDTDTISLFFFSLLLRISNSDGRRIDAIICVANSVDSDDVRT